jgi:hypothetical protein
MADLMTSVEVAEWLRVSRQTLHHWHSYGGGPPCTKVGGRLLYDRAAVTKWLASGAPVPTRPRKLQAPRRRKVSARSGAR